MVTKNNVVIDPAELAKLKAIKEAVIKEKQIVKK